MACHGAAPGPCGHRIWCRAHPRTTALSLRNSLENNRGRVTKGVNGVLLMLERPTNVREACPEKTPSLVGAGRRQGPQDPGLCAARARCSRLPPWAHSRLRPQAPPLHLHRHTPLPLTPLRTDYLLSAPLLGSAPSFPRPRPSLSLRSAPPRNSSDLIHPEFGARLRGGSTRLALAAGGSAALRLGGCGSGLRRRGSAPGDPAVGRGWPRAGGTWGLEGPGGGPAGGRGGRRGPGRGAGPDAPVGTCRSASALGLACAGERERARRGAEGRGCELRPAEAYSARAALTLPH